MGVDEQKEEREVLNSIFPDEITGQLRTTPYYSAQWLIDYENRYLRDRVSNIHQARSAVRGR